MRESECVYVCKRERERGGREKGIYVHKHLDAGANDVSIRNGDQVGHSVARVDHRARQSAFRNLVGAAEKGDTTQ